MTLQRRLTRVAVEAMATRFELVLVSEDGDDARARAIGEEALAEIVRLEARLSLFRPSSDVAAINAHAYERAVKVEPALVAFLRRCLEIASATDGAFDVTSGPLTRLWKGATTVPSATAVENARRSIGYEHIVLDEDACTIRFARPGMSIDPGAAGKGYAIDRAIEILTSLGVSRALLHGGTSSIHALGAPPGREAWPVSWNGKVFGLKDSALSVSSVRGRMFTSGGIDYGHVIDPRTGWPSQDSISALVTGPRSFECDALSTGLLVLGAEWVPALRARFPGYDGAVSSAAS